jgi:hypothetical protein
MDRPQRSARLRRAFRRDRLQARRRPGGDGVELGRAAVDRRLRHRRAGDAPRAAGAGRAARRAALSGAVRRPRGRRRSLHLQPDPPPRRPPAAGAGRHRRPDRPVPAALARRAGDARQRGALSQPHRALLGLVLGAGRSLPPHLHVQALRRPHRAGREALRRPTPLGRPGAQPVGGGLGAPPRPARAPRAVPRLRDAAPRRGPHRMGVAQRRAGVRRRRPLRRLPRHRPRHHRAAARRAAAASRAPGVAPALGGRGCRGRPARRAAGGVRGRGLGRRPLLRDRRP